MELVASSIAIASKFLVLGYDEGIQKSDLDDIFFYNWSQRTKRNRAVSNFESRSKIKSYISSVVSKNTPSVFIYHFRVSHEVFEVSWSIVYCLYLAITGHFSSVNNYLLYFRYF